MAPVLLLNNHIVTHAMCKHCRWNVHHGSSAVFDGVSKTIDSLQLLAAISIFSVPVWELFQPVLYLLVANNYIAVDDDVDG